MLEAVKSYFDRDSLRLARFYDQRSWFAKNVDLRLRTALFSYVRLVTSQMADWTGVRVVDVGCGVGALAAELAARGAKVTAIDVSPGMMEQTRIRAQAAGVESRIEYFEGDVYDFVLRRQFDVVNATGIAEYMDDPLLFLIRLRELSCGMVIVTFAANNSIWTRFRRARYRLHGIRIRYYTRNKVLELADQAGLRVGELLEVGGGWLLFARPR